jgi:rod shape-determining protein MreC
MIGTIAEVTPATGGSFLNVKVKLSTNFTSLRSVYIINNLQKEEIETIEEQISSGN